VADCDGRWTVHIQGDPTIDTEIQGDDGVGHETCDLHHDRDGTDQRQSPRLSPRRPGSRPTWTCHFLAAVTPSPLIRSERRSIPN